MSASFDFGVIVEGPCSKFGHIHTHGQLKGLRTVARALWRIEARRVVPWSKTLHELRLVQGRSQGTTLSASDLHNARATIHNPFYNMEYKIIKKIRQNKTWIETDIACIKLTPYRLNAFAPVIGLLV